MFLDWHATGSQFAALVGAGSVYLLILITRLGLHVTIGFMLGQALFDLANIIQVLVKGILYTTLHLPGLINCLSLKLITVNLCKIS